MKRLYRKKTRKVSYFIFLTLVLLITILTSFLILSTIAKILKYKEVPTNFSAIIIQSSYDDLVRLLKEKNIEVESLKISSVSANVIAKLKDGPTVYFTLDKDIAPQVSSLQLIITRLTIDGGQKTESKKPTLIDLRFVNPVVKF